MLLIKQLKENIGALVEVRSNENDLIYVGKLSAVGEMNITVSEDKNGSLPPPIYNMEVKLNIRGPHLSLMVLGGRVGMSGEDFWCVNTLRHYKSSENRNYFRQRVSARAVVSRVALYDIPDADAYRVNPEVVPGEEVDAEEKPVPARLVDISLGGILFGSREMFAQGELVELTNVMLLTDELPFKFLCKILRVDTQSRPDMVLCGCKFEQMPEREQDRLCRAIFVLQRNELRKRRQQ